MTTRPAGSASSPTSTFSVVVVGGGIAGLACAVATARAGAQVEVIEEQALLPDPPAHLHVVPNMLRELVALGVGRACVEQAFPYRGMHVTDLAGRRHGELSYKRLAGPAYPAAMGMRHGAFLRVLRDAGVKAGVSLSSGIQVDRIERDGDRSAVFANDKASPRRPDLVVFAGGADSPLRAALHPEVDVVTSLGQSWTYMLVPRPSGLDDLRLMLGTGPGSRRLLLVPISGQTACLVVMDPADAAAQSGETQVGAIRDFLQEASPLTRDLARHVAPDAPAVKRIVQAGLLAGDWHRGNVICVGDTAHAMPPQFGQSAAMALEDAIVLGELLALKRDPVAIGEAFTARRSPRARAVFDIVLQAALWEASPDRDTDLLQLSRRLEEAVACPP